VSMSDDDLRGLLAPLDDGDRARLAEMLEQIVPPKPTDYDTPIVLTRPIKVQNQDVEELPIRNQPNAAHFEEIETMSARGKVGMEIIRVVMGRILGVSADALKQVHAADVPAVVERFKDFFGRSDDSTAAIRAGSRD
jgi:hypothetical protein